MPTAQPLMTGDPRRLGEYALSGRLGAGGQGLVYLGWRDGEAYAVKLLHGTLGDERAAFLREVELAKHVARFCTAQVIEAGFDEGRPYIVSEYVDGPSLHREVVLTGPRRGAALERLAVSTATALAAIHRAGIVHRDFKPQNVLLGVDGPRVIDFGLARALDAAATVSGRGVGTPAYMAPEQITALAVTGAADVFSWGATMCFAANASAPFGQDSVAPVLHRILTAPPELGRLDGWLRELVAACLDKDARNRPTSSELLLALLGDAGHGFPAVPRGRPRAPGGSQSSWDDGVPGVPAGPVAGGGAYRRPEHGWSAESAWAAESGQGVESAWRPETGPAVESGRGAEGGRGAEPGAPGMALAEPEATGAPHAYHLARPAPDPGTADDGAPDGRASVVGVPEGQVSADPVRDGGAQAGSAAHSSPPGAGGRGASGAGRGWAAGALQDGGWLRAALAVSAALLVTAVVLLTVIAPTLGRVGAASQAVAAPPRSTVTVTPADGGTRTRRTPETSAPPRKTGDTRKAGETQGGTRPAGGPKPPATRPAPGGTATPTAPVTVAVPPLEGLDRAAAARAIKRAGLASGEVTEVDSPQPVGRVLGSAPAAGAAVAKGTAVALTVSAGLEVPAVAGMSRTEAEAALTAAGLTAGPVTRSCSAGQDGRVLSSEPGAGTRVAGGTPVGLVVARDGAPVPPVTGRSLAEGRSELVAAGFTVRVRSRPVEDASRVDVILAQSVQAGTCAGPGTTVVVTVGVATQSEPEPDDPGDPGRTPPPAD
ncbi:PASTA domain-containing protein [Nonomuraea pusilla]|uniref:serine/threonine protein kinase n=1 Tax=Nonomuraea pusilla TaxID=46177 RepID=UPI00332AD17A